MQQLLDRRGPDGTTMTADELARATATNLHGEFATAVATDQVCAALSTRQDGPAGALPVGPDGAGENLALSAFGSSGIGLARPFSTG